MKTLSPKLLQVLHFLVTLRPENVLLDVDGHVRRGFLPVFSRFVMWCCEQRPLSHLRLTDFGLAKMGLRLDLDFFQVTWFHIKSHDSTSSNIHQRRGQNLTSTMCGTPEYLPPEVHSLRSLFLSSPEKDLWKRVKQHENTSCWGFQTAVLCLWIGLACSSESPYLKLEIQLLQWVKNILFEMTNRLTHWLYFLNKNFTIFQQISGKFHMGQLRGGRAACWCLKCWRVDHPSEIPTKAGAAWRTWWNFEKNDETCWFKQ